MTHKKQMVEAKELRKVILRMAYEAGSGHIGGSLSSLEILMALYFSVLHVDPGQPEDEDRDRFILSKGHAAPALYAVLAYRGFFPIEELLTLRKLGSRLQGHPCRDKLPGIELSTGSLGLGISAGVGMALAAKLKNKAYKIYVLCGDGELNEGQNWEAMMTANKWNLDNLIIIIDKNDVQLDGLADEIMPMGDLEMKLRAFGIHTRFCPGHDIEQIMQSLNEMEKVMGPKALIARTIKGKGVDFMENRSEWHGKRISEHEYLEAINQL